MVQKFFQKIAEKINKRGRRVFFLAMVFLLVSVFSFGLFAHQALAQTGGSASPLTVAFVPDFIFDLSTRIMLAVTRLALSLMLFVLTFIVQVASYNNYLNSEAVNVGWVMVRDLTNMVFVVALLIIAFGTILGIEHYEWKHMLFKLVAAAVLVNFSRVICGVIIDVAQVVMITFVNGIASTVGGNFIRAFSLDSIRSFSSATSVPINSEGVWLSALASLFISVTILVTSGILLAMLVARVIVLWVLIVLSPIAFVLGVLDQTKSYASEWWSQFGKNVITGPVLVFFLWLTLVTVGNGMVNKQFCQASGTGVNVCDQDSGIGKAMKWDNLVNFVIAIGMLLVGIKVTQQLGGIGAEWTGKAVDIGKRVTMAVSGVSTVRKTAAKGYELAGKGVELAKRKMPVIGGEALERYGKGISGRVGLAMGKVSEARVEAAKKFEREGKELGELKKLRERKEPLRPEEIAQKEKLEAKAKAEKWEEKGAGLRRFGKSLLAGVVETQGRAMKRAEDWQTAAKSQKETVEASYSVGHYAGGKAKLTADIRLQQAKGISEAKKVQKSTEEENRLLESSPEFRKRQEDLYAAKASADYQKDQLESVKSLLVANKMDDEAIRRGDKPVYAAAEVARQAKIKQDRLANLTFNEITQRNADIANDIANLDAKFNRPGQKELSPVQYREERRRLGENLVATLTSCMKQGAEAGMTALNKAATAAHFNDEVGAGDLEGQQRKLFSVLVGKRVEKGGLEKAMGEFTEMHGEAKAQAMLRSLDESMKNVARDGAPVMKGLLNSKEVDSKTGFSKYKLESNDADGIMRAKDQQRYWRGSTPISKVISLDGLITSNNEGITKDVSKLDQQSLENFASVFSRVTKGTQLDSRLVDQLKTMNSGVRGELIKALAKENKVAAKNLREKLGEITVKGEEEEEPEPNET